MSHVARQLARTIGLVSHAPFAVSAGQRAGWSLSHEGVGAGVDGELVGDMDGELGATVGHAVSGHNSHSTRQFSCPNLSTGKQAGAGKGEGGSTKNVMMASRARGGLTQCDARGRD